MWSCHFPFYKCPCCPITQNKSVLHTPASTWPAPPFPPSSSHMPDIPVSLISLFQKTSSSVIPPHVLSCCFPFLFAT